jgi:hypothetical protein
MSSWSYTMKTFLRRSVLAASLALCAAALADARTTDTVTNVPFAFTAGKTALPSDHYRISRIPGQNGAFLIRGERHGVVILSQPDAVTGRDAVPGLVFYRYGDQYFLREVRLESGIAFSLPKTRAEEDAAERVAGLRQSEVVVVPQ